MSAVRITVEINYKGVKQLWKSQEFKRNLKVMKAPISLLYKASALLMNFRICYYNGGQIKSQYNIRAPSIEEYLNNNNDSFIDS